MKYDTSLDKNSYTQYKDKLMNIMRKQEKECYKFLLKQKEIMSKRCVLPLVVLQIAVNFLN